MLAMHVEAGAPTALEQDSFWASVPRLVSFGARKGWKDQTQHAQPTGHGKKTACFALTAGTAHMK